jgi:NADPH:quinone reductase-like Zn-dependent oxidoreductase
MSKKADIDSLGPISKSLIDLTNSHNQAFDSVLRGFSLSKIMNDVILVEYTDFGDNNGDTIMRNGIAIPLSSVTQAWRIGKVVLTGSSVDVVKVGDYICFPNNMGVQIANVQVDNYGLLKKGVFLNEQRIFGVVSPLNERK